MYQDPEMFSAKTKARCYLCVVVTNAIITMLRHAQTTHTVRFGRFIIHFYPQTRIVELTKG